MPYPASLTALLTHRRTLLLQGPMGAFFARLADYLEEHGQKVYKVNFNGGDKLFYRRQRSIDYHGRHEQWGAWLRSLLVLKRIDCIVLFGQTRPIHVVARQVAEELKLPVFVFEEGYLRPDYVTLEAGGVNGYSAVPKDPALYQSLPSSPVTQPKPTGQTFLRMTLRAIAYYTAAALLRFRFPHHVYHRSLDPVGEGLRWVRGGVRKIVHGWGQRHLMEVLTAPDRSKQWFLVPLQVHNDSQILHHSPYGSVEDVIADVLDSFAWHADPAHWLVLKHHPMDRAYTDYTDFIARTASRLGIEKRVLYVHDLHLPTLLKHARGVVTVNSTTGLQALFHQTPVATLGECFYSIDGLVRQPPLANFWRDPGTVDAALYQRFRHYLVRHTQLNASFYARSPALDVAALQLVRRTSAHDDGDATLISQPMPFDELTLPLQPVQARPVQTAGVGEAHANDAAAAAVKHPDAWSGTQPARLQ
ncbi:capsular biosynthesis protein [Aquabacterium sp. A7-Y]|uniref:capsule biosynthesis protein n=1 Tax=Aquabacterium sp. A7-Y TaxID=1349605 RepID=UPI00223CBE9E|nr:capsular biosynthesis protein [Aquabacterium sp. A7-Y]MCW7538919.1 capsular biosynthesis protein [Aquabacterium sp. A7-Y]